MIMGKLTDDEAKALKDLEAKRDAKDDDGADEVEYWEDDKGGRGARMRVSRARTHGPAWLRDQLADRDDDGGKDAGGDAGADGEAGADKPAGAVRRFQRRVS